MVVPLRVIAPEISRLSFPGSSAIFSTSFRFIRCRHPLWSYPASLSPSAESGTSEGSSEVGRHGSPPARFHPPVPQISVAPLKEMEYDGDGLEAKSEKSGPQVATECSEVLTVGHLSYEVKEGDTLTSIANKYKVTVQSIALANKITDFNYIPAGEILLIPIGHLKSGEVRANADGSSHLVESQGLEGKSMVVHTESSLSRVPHFVSPISFQSCYVRLALFLVLLFALSTFLRRCISDLRTRSRAESLRYQVEKEVQDVHHGPKLRRWQGILDDDQRIDEADGDLFGDGRAVLDVEEEKLRQTYAQLESAYAKFLADSGLSKSGYWRGGTPPALEE